jgi:hypothetical protein
MMMIRTFGDDFAAGGEKRQLGRWDGTQEKRRVTKQYGHDERHHQHEGASKPPTSQMQFHHTTLSSFSDAVP